MAGSHAFKWTYGDSLSFTVTWSPGGTPQDLTGYTVDMKVRDKTSDEELLHLYSDTNGLSVSSPETDGKIVCSATPSMMKADGLINANVVHWYDLQVRSSDGSVIRTLIAGDFQVEKEATDVDS
jgi:hypothetical protein